MADPAHVPTKDRPEATFLPGLIADFLRTLKDIVPSADGEKSTVECSAVLHQDWAWQVERSLCSSIYSNIDSLLFCLLCRDTNDAPGAWLADSLCRFCTGDEAMAGAEGDTVDRQALLYCERSVELFTDLLSQLPTRAFVHTVLEDKAVLVKCKLSRLHAHPSGTDEKGVPAFTALLRCVTQGCIGCSR